MQPSGNRYGSSITQAGGDYGRSVAPQYVEDVINSVKPIVQENGNLKYVGGSLEVVTNPPRCCSYYNDEIREVEHGNFRANNQNM